MAVANGDRQDWVGRVSMTKKCKQRRNEIRRGHGCLETHTKIWGKVGPICLPFGEASAGYLYESETAAIQCTLHRERGGKVKAKVKRESLTSDRARGVVCEGEPVIRLESSE